jgi:hypothetical protein
MKATICIVSLLLLAGCQHARIAETISMTDSWRFAPDEANSGPAADWHTPQFNDSQWDTLDAGLRWEDQGYKEMDGFGWYRKQVEIPAHWKGQRVWLKFGGVNDAYTLFVNGNEVSTFGAANISFAGKPSISEITEYLDFGAPNLIAVQVNDWGGSGGLWHLPAELTTDEDAVSNLFSPMSKTPITPERLGYALFWEDNFDGNALDDSKWAVRGEGPRAVGYVSSEAVTVEDGFLKITAFEKDGNILTGAVGTQGRFMTTYGYFECRAQLQKSPGNWAAFWIQSPGIAKGEDPGEYGVEIDIFEYFKKSGEDIVSHNLHWAYGPNQQTIGALESKREGVGEGFHTFAVEWTPEKYAFFVDGYKYHEVTRAISHTDEYIILSMELPATMEGLKDSVFPDVFIVDYVRVYKKE